MREINPVAVGQKIAELRINRQESREDAAKALNISASALAMYEQGNRIPRDNIKIRIADHYGVTVGDIFFV